MLPAPSPEDYGWTFSVITALGSAPERNFWDVVGWYGREDAPATSLPCEVPACIRELWQPSPESTPFDHWLSYHPTFTSLGTTGRRARSASI